MCWSSRPPCDRVRPPGCPAAPSSCQSFGHPSIVAPHAARSALPSSGWKGVPFLWSHRAGLGRPRRLRNCPNRPPLWTESDPTVAAWRVASFLARSVLSCPLQGRVRSVRTGSGGKSRPRGRASRRGVIKSLAGTCPQGHRLSLGISSTQAACRKGTWPGGGGGWRGGRRGVESGVGQ